MYLSRFFGKKTRKANVNILAIYRPSYSGPPSRKLSAAVMISEFPHVRRLCLEHPVICMIGGMITPTSHFTNFVE